MLGCCYHGWLESLTASLLPASSSPQRETDAPDVFPPLHGPATTLSEPWRIWLLRCPCQANGRTNTQWPRLNSVKLSGGARQGSCRWHRCQSQFGSWCCVTSAIKHDFRLNITGKHKKKCRQAQEEMHDSLTQQLWLTIGNISIHIATQLMHKTIAVIVNNNLLGRYCIIIFIMWWVLWNVTKYYPKNVWMHY